MPKPNSEIVLVRWTPAYETETGGQVRQDYTHILTERGTEAVLRAALEALPEENMMVGIMDIMGWLFDDLWPLTKTIETIVKEAFNGVPE